MSARALLFIDQAIVSVLLVGLLILVFQLRREWKVAWTRRELLALLLISLGALAFRLLWIKPALIHGDWQGALLVQSVLDFPAPGGLHDGSYGKNYGQGSFITLGLLSLIFGKIPQGVLGSNVLRHPLIYESPEWDRVARLRSMLKTGSCTKLAS